MISRRTFLQGMVAGAAGLLIPERKVWALDQTMITPLGNHDTPFNSVPGWMDRMESTPFTQSLVQAEKEMRKVQEREIIYGDGALHVFDTRGWHEGNLFSLGYGENREFCVVTGVFPMAGRLTIRRLEYT